MINIHIILRLLLNVGALSFGYNIYKRIKHIGIMALVASVAISTVIEMGLLFDIITRSVPFYSWSVDLIRLLSMIGLYSIWKAVDDIQ